MQFKPVSLLLSLLFPLAAIGQQTEKSVDLNEVVIKNQGPQQLNKKVKAQNVHFMFKQHTPEEADSTYFATRFPAFDTVPVRLSSVELKLKPFDSTVLGVELLVLQLNGKDTVFVQIPVDGAAIDKHNKLKLYVADRQIVLQASPFFLGYRFIARQIPENGYSYRTFSSDKGEGAIIYAGKTGLRFHVSEHMPYIFPFKIAYYPVLQ